MFTDEQDKQKADFNIRLAGLKKKFCDKYMANLAEKEEQLKIITEEENKASEVITMKEQ